ncbi:MAG TPA: YkvA family protein [Candidatus Limnocylindrales bacterium]|nr:YkvA family protein [Candidatus Limnocylindrales bacterium]
MSRDTWIVLLIVGFGLLALVTLIVAVKFALRLLATKRMLGELGTGGKIAFYGALLYTIFPVDLLPDPIYLDDIGVLAAALAILTKTLRSRRRGTAKIPEVARQNR